MTSQDVVADPCDGEVAAADGGINFYQTTQGGLAQAGLPVLALFFRVGA